MTQEVTAKYVEIGIGNPSMINSEWEYADGTEQRFKGIRRPFKITEVYLRCWFGTSMFVISSKEGFKKKTKTRKAFKVLLGFGGM